MIPQGTIYFRMRSEVLTAYPPGTQASIRDPITLGDWFTKGSYRVTAADNKQITLELAIADVSSAMLTDVELLSNHCFEHLQEMLCYARDTRPRSDAWHVVTIYYFSFFTAQLLLRLLGCPVVFISREQMTMLKKLSPSPTNLGQGAYRLEKIRNLSATAAEVALKPAPGKIHEATWKRLFGQLSGYLSNPPGAPDAREILFYELITTRVLFRYYGDYEWPSLVRTRANYRPGYAYRLLEGKPLARSKTGLLEWEDADSSDLLSILQTSVLHCGATREPDFHEHVKLLHDVAQSLFLLSRMLYFELLERTGIDRRWEQKRREFRKRMAFANDAFTLIAPTSGC